MALVFDVSCPVYIVHKNVEIRARKSCRDETRGFRNLKSYDRFFPRRLTHRFRRLPFTFSFLSSSYINFVTAINKNLHVPKKKKEK